MSQAVQDIQSVKGESDPESILSGDDIELSDMEKEEETSKSPISDIGDTDNEDDEEEEEVDSENVEKIRKRPIREYFTRLSS